MASSFYWVCLQQLYAIYPFILVPHDSQKPLLYVNSLPHLGQGVLFSELVRGVDAGMITAFLIRRSRISLSNATLSLILKYQQTISRQIKKIKIETKIKIPTPAATVLLSAAKAKPGMPSIIINRLIEMCRILFIATVVSQRFVKKTRKEI